MKTKPIVALLALMALPLISCGDPQDGYSGIKPTYEITRNATVSEAEEAINACKTAIEAASAMKIVNTMNVDSRTKITASYIPNGVVITQKIKQDLTTVVERSGKFSGSGRLELYINSVPESTLLENMDVKGDIKTYNDPEKEKTYIDMSDPGFDSFFEEGAIRKGYVAAAVDGYEDIVPFQVFEQVMQSIKNGTISEGDYGFTESGHFLAVLDQDTSSFSFLIGSDGYYETETSIEVEETATQDGVMTEVKSSTYEKLKDFPTTETTSIPSLADFNQPFEDIPIQ